MFRIREEKMVWLKRLLLIVTFTLLAVFVYVLVKKVFFPSTADAPAGHMQQIVKKPQSAPKPATPPPPPKPAPDYTLPPITGGLAPVLSRIPTSQPVVFLGIDDGGYKDLAEIDLMKANNIKATLFLSNAFILDNPSFFKQVSQQTGAVIEDHTLHHYIDLPYRSFAEQKAEICGEADYMQQEYGRRPVLFRPPGGAYSVTTQEAAAACGMKAIINWIAKANGGSMQYQIGNGLRSGDIVLMHFRPVFAQDMQAFVQAEKAAGLHTELLEDWLTPGL